MPQQINNFMLESGNLEHLDSLQVDDLIHLIKGEVTDDDECIQKDKVDDEFIDNPFRESNVKPNTSEKQIDEAQYRILFQARPINKLMVPTSTILPRSEDMMITFGGKNCVYGSTDISSYYWQISTDTQYQQFFTAATPDGLYRPKRVVQGDSSAVAGAQYCAQEMIRDMKNATCLIDDLAWAADNPHSFLDGLEALFFKMGKISTPGEHVKLRPDKCYFLSDSIKFLGKHI